MRPSIALLAACSAGSIRALLITCALLLSQPTGAGELSPYEGPQPPAFILPAVDGTQHRLEDYRGKVVLVNFWATWCPPCVAELPSMQRLADGLAAEPFEILAVNVGESPFQVDKFMKLTRARFTALLDRSGDVFQAWGGSVYPTSFVIDRAGRIRYIARGPLEWDGDEIVAALKDLVASEPAPAE